MPGGNYRLLSAETADRLLPHHLTLNYADLFKIQRVRNPFLLRSVSVARVLAYLECPGCALNAWRERHSTEPWQFRKIDQTDLFHSEEPDLSLTNMLLHEAVDLLHVQQGLIQADQRALLLSSPEALTRFLRFDFFSSLQKSGKVQLAMLFHEISEREKAFQSILLAPVLAYQQELQLTQATVFAPTEHFQFKLLSTRSTFAGHQDWGGYVGLVGGFDQIRLRKSMDGGERPAIVKFQKDLGQNRPRDQSTRKKSKNGVEMGLSLRESNKSQKPGMAYALQLMIDWLALQTRWDVLGQVQSTMEPIIDLPMSMEQNLDLILYHLPDGRQYQLISTQMRETLLFAVNCLFFVNWAMKSGYAWQSPEHNCQTTVPLNATPNPLIQVGPGLLSARECYQRARDTFQSFSKTVNWRLLPGE